MRASSIAKTIVSKALLVRTVPYGEADLVVQLFTEGEGRLSAIVRGGRRPSRRVGGALEPFHTLVATLEDRGTEMCTLKEARVVGVRARLVGSLDALEAGGRALRWVRHVCPPRTPEPAAWATLNSLLDGLDAAMNAEECARILAWAGLRLLVDLGYGLELERCVRCTKPCPEGRLALLDMAAGGLVCVSCGGGPLRVEAAVREAALAVLRAGTLPELEMARAIGPLVDAAMAAHADYDASLERPRV